MRKFSSRAYCVTASLPPALLIMGPTASGKSALALALAERLGGEIINADSMQIYRDLRVLTARPTSEEEARAPHLLYGFVDAAVRYSVGAWLGEALDALAAVRARGRTPIVVGGTGLYFKALTDGLASIPPIPPDLRARLLAETADVDAEALYARLVAVDAETATGIRPSDRARILRGLEVFEATGRPLAEWRRGNASPPLLAAARTLRIVLDPPRPWLHHRIDRKSVV